MRYDYFGEAYCHTADEVRRLTFGKVVYLPSYPPDPPEGDFGACIEIAESGSGETVCFIEAPTVEAVQAIVDDLGLPWVDTILRLSVEETRMATITRVIHIEAHVYPTTMQDTRAGKEEVQSIREFVSAIEQAAAKYFGAASHHIKITEERESGIRGGR